MDGAHYSDVVKKSFASIVLFAVIAGSFFLFGRSVGRTEGVSANAHTLSFNEAVAPEGIDFAPLWKAWHTINQKFVPASSSTVPTNEEKVWGIVAGLAESLEDPYTVFFPPVEAKQFQEDISGNFEGVGMEIGIREGILTVVAPLKNSPAERAGLKTGDFILRIDGEPTDGITIDKAVKRIRGERGTTVELTIAREGEEALLTIDVKRDVITIPTIDTELRSDGVFVISLYNFSAVSSNLFREALREFIESGSSRLILDLRGNPGGFLEAAVDMAGWFLPAGKVVVTEDFGQNGEKRIHRSRGHNIFNSNLKMIVLINGGSASASEILAGALREHGIATLVGEQSFGKGSVQELVSITDDTSLKITVARWLTPLGLSISDGGLTPDIVVSRDEEVPEDIDIILETAVKELLVL